MAYRASRLWIARGQKPRELPQGREGLEGGPGGS